MKNPVLYLLLILLSGCTEEYDFQFPKQVPKLVVEGIITNDPGPYYVRLAQSKSTFEMIVNDTVPSYLTYGSSAGGYVSVVDAIVLITDNFGVTDTLIAPPDSVYSYYSWNYNDPLSRDSTLEFNPKAHVFGYYQTKSLKGVPGNTYYLKILWRGAEYTSTCYMPPVPKIDSVTYEYTLGATGKSDFYIPKIWFKDNPATEDYYLFKTEGIVWGRSVLSDDNMNSDVSGLNVFQGETHEWWLNNYPWPGDTYRIEMSSITKEIYDYYKALIMQFRNDGGVYTPSPASPPTNITNGAQGYFRASSVQVVQDTMPGYTK
jgi:hypothetical protein